MKSQIIKHKKFIFYIGFIVLSSLLALVFNLSLDNYNNIDIDGFLLFYILCMSNNSILDTFFPIVCNLVADYKSARQSIYKSVFYWLVSVCFVLFLSIIIRGINTKSFLFSPFSIEIFINIEVPLAHAVLFYLLHSALLCASLTFLGYCIYSVFPNRYASCFGSLLIYHLIQFMPNDVQMLPSTFLNIAEIHRAIYIYLSGFGFLIMCSVLLIVYKKILRRQQDA